MNLKQRGKGGQPSPLLKILLMALCFLCGISLGQVLASRMPDTAGLELSEYLRQYVMVDSSVSTQTIWSAFLLYLRYPVLAVLLGFSSLGVVLLPGITVALGFFLSFSVSCFVVVFGPNGVLLALAVLGLRCLVTLPCYFLLAVTSWENSVILASLSIGRGRRSAPVTYGPDWWVRCGVCFLLLLAGVCAELFCVPFFLQMVLARIF